MKEYRFIIIPLIFSLIIPVVFAAMTIQESELNFGGSNYEKDNNPITQSINVDNNELEDVANLAFSFTSTVGFDKNNIGISSIPTSITTGSSATMDVDVSPDDFDAIDSNFDEVGEVTIGQFKVRGVLANGTNVETNEIPLKLEIENSLEIEAITLEYEDGSSDTLSEGSTYTVIEDEDLILKVNVESKFSSSGFDLTDIDIKIESQDLNLDESKSVSDLNGGDSTEGVIDFSVDEIKKKTVDITVEGKDELNGKHGQKFSFKLDVQEKPNEPAPAPVVVKDDQDGDGVSDVDDLCPNTLSSCSVDNEGCPLDADNDGICDDLDSTPNGNSQESGEAQQNPVVKQISNNENQQSEEKNKKESVSDPGESDSIIPFLIGFVIGIVLTAGFFWLIRS